MTLHEVIAFGVLFYGGIYVLWRIFGQPKTPKQIRESIQREMEREKRRRQRP
jgi:hypothetical protein